MQIILLLIVLLVCKVAADNKAIFEKVDHAIKVAKEQIAALHQEWEVDKYPNFLKSCFMHKSSWEILKYKYLDRLLQSIVTQKPQKFVASFSGR